MRNGINGFTAAYAGGGGVGSYQLTTFSGTSGTLRTTPAVAGTYDPLADFTVRSRHTAEIAKLGHPHPCELLDKASGHRPRQGAGVP